MKQYIQPKIILPINLHDAKVTSIEWDNKIGGINRGFFKLNMGEGFLVQTENGAKQTKSASVLFDKVDFDFCQIYAFKEEERKGITFEQVERILKHTEVEISELTFSTDLTKIWCYAYPPNDYYVIEIEIYHENETVYSWEE
ncbi:MAG: hypothetical protein R3Y18_02240 [Bacillota bacterium]